jgi:Phosphatidyl serine synthase.
VLAIASTREYYEYVNSDFKLRLGAHCWIAHILIFLEWTIVIKNTMGTFTEPMPNWLVYSWSIIVGFILAEALNLFYKDLSRK